MEILRFSARLAERIGRRPYDVKLASSIKLAEGAGEAHAYVVYFEPGGVIGPHEAGFGQIFFAVAGSGWVAGADDQRIALAEGEAAFINRGEVHAKGSESGLTALMVQVRDMTPLAGQQPDEPPPPVAGNSSLGRDAESGPGAR
jgi:quercetin dioxygenase-like cupin family protein